MTTGARAVIYTPPGAGLPFIGVVLGRDGEVLIARSAWSNAEANALLTTVMTHFHRKCQRRSAGREAEADAGADGGNERPQRFSGRAQAGRPPLAPARAQLSIGRARDHRFCWRGALWLVSRRQAEELSLRTHRPVCAAALPEPPNRKPQGKILSTAKAAFVQASGGRDRASACSKRSSSMSRAYRECPSRIGSQNIQLVRKRVYGAFQLVQDHARRR